MNLLNGQWIFINGQVYILNYKVSLQELFIFIQKKNPGLILEYNQKIISQNQAKNVFLKHLDRIEFVTIVGGG
uniref:Thiamine biosynthesis protein n=1 Tax=Eustigmatophyceae sp. WTwin 8/9 T-6m6.8 TaxID=2974615 RepID=UPI00218234EB|nr:Thiamine biosynthesis protein [Eustigmatophyceae sp. WTwin 8/9 T-6m6.8]UVI61006.1 Thiamine biosynthesis protein [Eustigmatophyceae sp. WTwin 8/9 T-6m6.8]